MTTLPSIACESAATVAQTAQAGTHVKARLRRTLLDARNAIDSTERSRRDAVLALHLQDWLQQHPVDLLGVYWPIRGEPDLREFYDRISATGVRLALPLVVGRELPLQFSAWVPGAPLVTDRWGIATPASIVIVAPQALLIPCVGFNSERFRLGYGGGYYDRTLALTPRAQAIGVAYATAAAVFAAAAHDIAMDVMITETAPGWPSD